MKLIIAEKNRTIEIFAKNIDDLLAKLPKKYQSKKDKNITSKKDGKNGKS